MINLYRLLESTFNKLLANTLNKYVPTGTLFNQLTTPVTLFIVIPLTAGVVLENEYVTGPPLLLALQNFQQTQIKQLHYLYYMQNWIIHSKYLM